jgi:hypothetical protein
MEELTVVKLKYLIYIITIDNNDFLVNRLYFRNAKSTLDKEFNILGYIQPPRDQMTTLMIESYQYTCKAILYLQ